MPKNKVQFQKGLSLPAFLSQYGKEEQCRDQFFQWRWPDGFECPLCRCKEHCTLKRRELFQCNRCHHQTSLTTGTIMESTKLPFTTWFLAMYLMTQTKNGISALELSRQLGISYNATWRLKHKLMQVMKERDDSSPLHGYVQVDDAYWGGEKHGGKPGRGSENKHPFVAAVETNEENHPLSMRFSMVTSFRKEELELWAKKHLSSQTQLVISDGLGAFIGIANAGHLHKAVVTGGGHASMSNELFTWVNTMIGNVKNSLRGSYHSINPKHLPRYLAEFCYRFNRRFDMGAMISRLG
ncbi:IS1595 family transposase, partial [Parendozoicomonas sp. Alg238-R29]|uniref:IS1595 family transposase n=1 Tax=Parendozoicomonas sp. Alg238-R29 TaxID=2993446 RepID=UPI00248D8310